MKVLFSKHFITKFGTRLLCNRIAFSISKRFISIYWSKPTTSRHASYLVELRLTVSCVQTIVTSVHKLSRWVDVTQLPPSFGGTFPYEPQRWCDTREVSHVPSFLNGLWLPLSDIISELRILTSCNKSSSCRTRIRRSDVQR